MKKAEKKIRQKAAKEKVKKLDSHVNARVSVATENSQIDYNLSMMKISMTLQRKAQKTS